MLTIFPFQTCHPLPTIHSLYYTARGSVRTQYTYIILSSIHIPYCRATLTGWGYLVTLTIGRYTLLLIKYDTYDFSFSKPAMSINCLPLNLTNIYWPMFSRRGFSRKVLKVLSSASTPNKPLCALCDMCAKIYAVSWYNPYTGGFVGWSAVIGPAPIPP